MTNTNITVVSGDVLSSGSENFTVIQPDKNDLSDLVTLPKTEIGSMIPSANIELTNLSSIANYISELHEQRSVLMPFALDLYTVDNISNSSWGSQILGNMYEVTLGGKNKSHPFSVLIPETAGVYLAPKYMANQIDNLRILRGGNYSVDVMLLRNRSVINIGEQLTAPNGYRYGTVIHYDLIGEDKFSEIWVLCQHFNNGWHVPLPTRHTIQNSPLNIASSHYSRNKKMAQKTAIMSRLTI